MFGDLFSYFSGVIQLLFSYGWTDFYVILLMPIVLSILYFIIKFIAKRA